MKRFAYWFCAFLAMAVTLAMFYWYGVTLVTVLVALLLLTCPFGVIWLTLRLAQQSDATVDATVTPLGLAPTGKRLEPMLINQTTTYGNFFDFPPSSGPFHIEVNITRPNLPVHSVVQFEYWQANKP
jgi:hypothetical protein